MVWLQVVVLTEYYTCKLLYVALPDVLYDFLSDDRPYNSSRPKAFLNWGIVEKEFKKTASSF